MFTGCVLFNSSGKMTVAGLFEVLGIFLMSWIVAFLRRLCNDRAKTGCQQLCNCSREAWRFTFLKVLVATAFTISVGYFISFLFDGITKRASAGVGIVGGFVGEICLLVIAVCCPDNFHSYFSLSQSE